MPQAVTNASGISHFSWDVVMPFVSQWRLRRERDQLHALSFLNLEMRLPYSKLLRLKSSLQRWAKLKKCCKKKDLESLVGQQHDASTVVRSRRTFIRRLIDLSKSAHHSPANSFVRLNVEARSDIIWWNLLH